MVPRRDAVVATLRQRFLSASHLGLLAPGDKLPSARELARELGVDRRVVLAAYRYLEREGVIELRQRSGIYFAPAAAGGRGANPRADARRTAWLADVVADAVGWGTPVPALADELHRHVSTLRLRAACVECNEDQIAALCGTLRDDYGFETAGVVLDPLADVTASFPALFTEGDGDSAAGPVPGPAPADRTADLPPGLRRADVLVTTPFHAGDVKLVAERLGKPWVAVELRADVFAELARRLEGGPAFAVVADPTFADKLRLIYRDAARAGRFRAFVVGRDDLAALPAGAPTLVTRLARERLAAGREAGAAPLAVREIAEPRALSAASARDVAAFLVGANAAALTRTSDSGTPNGP